MRCQVLAVAFALSALSALVARPALAAEPDAAVEGDPLDKELGATRPYSIDEYRKLFLAMWAQVPNWKSGDPLWIKRAEPGWSPPPRTPGAPRLRRPPPHEPEKLDWFAALDALDLEQLGIAFALDGLPKIEVPPVAPEHRAGLKDDAKKVLNAMRALAATHRAEAVGPLFRLAFTLDGAFRDECGRQIRAIGDAAVAPLVRLQYQRGAPSAPLNKQRRYAMYQLDRMDRARPSKAVDAAPDDKARAELMKAYGEVRAPDAVEAVLGQITAQSHRVRREARAAFRSYVEGPPPPPAPKRKRRLPGGKEESEEKADYLTYREVAELALQKRVAEVGLTMTEPHPTAAQMFQALVARDDAERAAEWERAFVTAHDHAEAGDVEGAVAEYEWILAHDPTTARRLEMVPAYTRLAAARVAQNRLEAAAGLYWKAVALAPAGAPEARNLEAEASFLDAERAMRHGGTDEAALRHTLALVPDHARARAAIAAIERRRARREARVVAIVAGALFLVVLLGTALVFSSRRRSRT